MYDLRASGLTYSDDAMWPSGEDGLRPRANYNDKDRRVADSAGRRFGVLSPFYANISEAVERLNNGLKLLPGRG